MIKFCYCKSYRLLCCKGSKVESRTFRSETIFCFLYIFKNNEKCLLFHPKSSSRSHDIYHSLVNKQLQYTHQEVKSIRELNWYNLRRGTFFLKNHTKNVVEKIFPEPSLKIKIEPISGQLNKVLYSLFLLTAKLRIIEAYWN